MVSTRAPSSRTKALLLAALAILGLFAAVQSVRRGGKALIESPGAKRFVERRLSGQSGLSVSLQSLTWMGRGRIAGGGLAVRKGGELLATVPRAELAVSLRGILRGRAGRLTLEEPEILLPLPDTGRGKRAVVFPPVDLILVDGGTVHFRREGGEDVTVGPFSFSLAPGRDGTATVRGEANVPFLDRPLAFESRIDPAALALADGEVRLRGLEFALPAGGGPVTGSLDATARLLSADGNGAGIAVSIPLRMASPPSGALPAGGWSGNVAVRMRLLDSYHRAAVEGEAELAAEGKPEDVFRLRFDLRYDRDGRRLDIASLALSSEAIGRATASGTIAPVPGVAPSWTMALNVEKLSLVPLLSGSAGGAPLLGATVAGEAQLRGSGGAVRDVRAAARCRDLRLPEASPLKALEGLPLEAAVHLHPGEGGWTVESFRLEAGTFPPLSGEGRLIGIGRPDFAVDGVLETAGLSLPEMNTLLGHHRPAVFAGLRGEVRIGGRVRVRGRPANLVLAGDVRLEGETVEYAALRAEDFSAGFSFTAGGNTLTLADLRAGAATVRLDTPPDSSALLLHDADLSLAGLTGGGTLSATGLQIRAATGQLDRLPGGASLFVQDAHLSFPLVTAAGDGSVPPASMIFGSAESVLSREGRTPWRESGLELAGIFSRDGPAGSLRFGEGALRRGGSLLLSIGGIVVRPAAGTVDADVSAGPFELPSLGRLLPSLGNLAETNAVRGKASARAAITAVPRDGGGHLLRGSVTGRIEDGGFSSPDGTRAAEGIHVEGTLSGAVTLPGGEGTLQTRIGADGFELLLGRFYGDFRERRITAVLAGGTEESGTPFRLRELDLSLDDLAAVSFRGSIAADPGGGAGSGRVSVAIPSHDAFFSFFLRDTFGDLLPWLRGLSVEGATRAAAELAVRENGDFSLDGAVRAEGGAIRSGDLGLSVEGVELVMPMRFSSAGGGPPAPEYGTLRWDGVAWGDIRLPPGEVRPAFHDGDLTFRDDAVIPLWGGRVVLGDVVFRQILDPGRSVALTVDVEDLDLNVLSAALGLPALKGSASGRFAPVTYRGGAGEARGSVVARVFGGAVQVENPSAAGLWGSVPSFGLSLSLENIDLGAVTDAFDFGRITGIVEGAVTDLEFAAGEVQHFDARLQTVKRRGVPQKISVEALEKISILGSGEQAGILSRGIYQLFKEYRYDRMGFAAVLENDHLRLSGIHQEGDRTYLVKGGILPPKADVISFAQEISFRQMVERVRRIGRVGAGSGGKK